MRIVGLLFCLALSATALAQQPGQAVRYDNNYVPPTKAQLEAKRKEIQDAINETEHQLEDIKKNKNATMSQLRALQYKLAQRQKLISNINDEMENIDHSIVQSSKEILTLKQKLEMLKIRYAQSIRYSYETRSSYDMLAFLFSSNDFNDAVRRMKYLKKFRDFRKQQVDQINETQNQIQHKIGDLNKEKVEKDQLLVSQKQQSQSLLGDVKETNNVIQDLKGKESELMKQAEKNRVAAAKVNKFIHDIIEREMRAALKKAEEEEKRKAAAAAAAAALANHTIAPAPPKDVKTGVKPTNPIATTTTVPHTRIPKADDAGLMLTPTDVTLANSFEGNKGKMYWPVSQGYIADHFGTHPHPLAHNVMIDNDGIDIRTSHSASVRTVFEGEVGSIFTVEGAKTVMVRHGNYFTVYGNLSAVSVKSGQHVNTLQSLGVADDNDEGEPTLRFQIWKFNGKNAQVKLNPEQWIGKVR